MPNEQYLEEFVSPTGFKQLQDLSAAVAANNKQLQDGIVIAKQYTDQIGSAKGIGDFNSKAVQAAKAQEDLAKKIAQTQLAEQRLEDLKAKNASTQEAREAKAKASEDRRVAQAEARAAKLQAIEDKRIARIAESEAKEKSLEIAKIERIKRIEAQEVERNKREDKAFKDEQSRNKQISGQEASYAAAIRKTSATVATNTAAVKGNSKAKAAALLSEAQAAAAATANSVAIKKQAIETIAAKGSIDQRSAALARLTATYYALNAAERASYAGVRLGTQIIPGLTAQVAMLQAETTAATGATSALAGSFSILRTVANILPGIGIAGLIAFATGPIMEYFSKLSLLKGKISELINIRKEVSAANLTGAQDAQLEIVQLKVLYDTSKDVTIASGQRYDAAKKLQELYPKTFENYSIEQIQLGKVDAGYLKLAESILATARARASEQKIAENSSRQLSNEEMINEAKIEIERLKIVKKRTVDREFEAQQNSTNDAKAIASATRISSVTKSIADQEKIIRDAKRDSQILDGRNLALYRNIYNQQKKGADLADLNNQKSKADKTKEQPTNYGNTLEDIIKQSEAIFKNDQNSYEKRLGALDSYIQNSQLLAEGDEGKLNLIKLNGEKERTKIVDQANAEQLKLVTESEKARVQELISSNNEQFDAVESIREKDTIALEARYNLGKIDKEEYEKELFIIESNYAKDRIALQIDTLAQIVEIQRSDLAIGIGTNEDLKKSERELSALRIQLAQLQRKEVKQTSEERIKAAEKELSAIKQLTEKSLEFGKALIDGVYTRRLNALSDESAAINKKKQQDIENVNDSVLTEQQKADQIAIINARAESQQSAIDERIRQQKIKQARADKAQAIAQIIIQTALAQIKVIGQAGILGFVFSPLITALGALSLATAIATPIPKFAVGTEHSPEGLAWVGERGTEGRINPDGTTELTPNKPTLTYLEKGTKIIPNHKLYNKMAKPDKSNFAGAEQVPWSQLIQEQRQTTKVLKKAFGDQSVNSTQVTKGGWKATQTKMSNLQKHIKRNLS